MIRLLMHPKHGRMYANDVHHEKVLRSQGWVDDDGVALKQKLAALEEPSGPTVESLRTELEARGIMYDRRWGLQRLTEALG